MCEYCDDTSTDMILDCVLSGLHLEVSIALVRDRVTQYGLRADGSAAEVLDNVRLLIETVEHQAEKLRDMPTQDFRDVVMARHVTVTEAIQ